MDKTPEEDKVLIKYSSYTQAQKKATQKYREKNKDKVNEQRKKYYQERKDKDPEFLTYKRMKAREYYRRRKEREAEGKDSSEDSAGEMSDSTIASSETLGSDTTAMSSASSGSAYSTESTISSSSCSSEETTCSSSSDTIASDISVTKGKRTRKPKKRAETLVEDELAKIDDMIVETLKLDEIVSEEPVKKSRKKKVVRIEPDAEGIVEPTLKKTRKKVSKEV